MNNDEMCVEREVLQRGPGVRRAHQLLKMMVPALALILREILAARTCLGPREDKK